MLHSEKLKEHLNLLDKQADKTALLKNAAMAIHVLKKTIMIRNETEEMFEIKDDISICEQAIDCIMEDINYDCYLDKE